MVSQLPPSSSLSGSRTPGSKPELTIVLVSDGSELGHRLVSENFKWLLDSSIPLGGIHIAGPRLPETESGRTSAVHNVSHSSDLKSCLSGIVSESSSIAILGVRSVLDESLRPVISRQVQDSETISWFQSSPVPSQILTRFLAFVARTIQRLALGTGKHELNCGGAIVHSSVLVKLQREGIPIATIDQLIAGCRTLGSTVTETRIGLSAESGPDTTVRSVFAEFTAAMRFWWQQIVFPKTVAPAGSNPPSEPESHKTWISRHPVMASAILLSAALLVMFTSLEYPLFEPDETRNAQLALNILESGDWLSLSLGGEPYWDKPPLQAWMTATTYSLIGPGEAATRLPCAICCFLTLLVVLGLGGRLFGIRTGLFGAALLLVCTGFVTVSRYVTMDASLTLFTTAMSLATLLGVRDDIVRLRWMVLAGIACGLGMLTKGPVILVLSLPPVLLYGWLRGSTFWRKAPFWLWPGIPAFLIAGPWFLATSIVHPDFLVYFFWKHNIVRFSDAFNHREPFWYYGPMLLLMMYPACFMLPALVRGLLFGSRKERQEFGTEFSAILLAGAWPLLFFSASDAKLPTYILPAIPMFCLLLGRMVDLAMIGRPENVSHTGIEKIPERLATSAAIMMGIILIVAVFVFRTVETAQAAPLAGTLAITLPFLWLARRKQSAPTLAWTGAIGVAVLFSGTGATLLLPGLAAYKSVNRDVASLSHETGFERTPILYFGVAVDGSSFSLDQDDVPVSIDGEDSILAAQYLVRHPQTILVTSKDNAKTLARNLAGIVELTPQPGQKKLYSVRAVRPTHQTAQLPDFGRHN